MRLKEEDILKPGAQMVVEKIDFSDPKNAELLKYYRETARNQARLLRQMNRPFKNLVITI